MKRFNYKGLAIFFFVIERIASNSSIFLFFMLIGGWMIIVAEPGETSRESAGRIFIEPFIVTDGTNIEISDVEHEGEVHNSWDFETSEFGYRFPAAVKFVIKLYNENKEDDDDDKERKVETSISLPVKRMPI